jgi:3-dehydroquinate dehydratase-2
LPQGRIARIAPERGPIFGHGRHARQSEVTGQADDAPVDVLALLLMILFPVLVTSQAARRLTPDVEADPQRGNRMSARLMILNGPNLDFLGVREPHIYGTTTLAAVEASCRAFAAHIGATLAFHQSNHEGELVELIHSARQSADVIIFSSVAIIDALKIFERPVIELHITNIHARDALHSHSIISSTAKAVICGLGTYGYIVAMQAAAQLIGALPADMPDPMRIGPR